MFDPVCGTNSETYGNPCALENAACDDPTIKLAYPGPCKNERSKFIS